MTTTELRRQDFEFIVAPDARGTASGKLYFDDGESIVQRSTTKVNTSFKNGRLDVSGSFAHATEVKVSRVRFLGVTSAPKQVSVDGVVLRGSQVSYNAASSVLDVSVGKPFVKGFSVQFA